MIQCLQCRFAFFDPKAGDTGQCRRHCPALVLATVNVSPLSGRDEVRQVPQGMFPLILKDWACGEGEGETSARSDSRPDQSNWAWPQLERIEAALGDGIVRDTAVEIADAAIARLTKPG